MFSEVNRCLTATLQENSHGSHVLSVGARVCYASYNSQPPHSSALSYLIRPDWHTQEAHPGWAAQRQALSTDAVDPLLIYSHLLLVLQGCGLRLPIPICWFASTGVQISCGLTLKDTTALSLMKNAIPICSLCMPFACGPMF